MLRRTLKMREQKGSATRNRVSSRYRILIPQDCFSRPGLPATSFVPVVSLVVFGRTCANMHVTYYRRVSRSVFRSIALRHLGWT